MAVDYKGIMEDLLAEGMDCASFFARVDNYFRLCVNCAYVV
jgi:hypothetical protein